MVLSPESLQNQKHKIRCRGVRPIEALRLTLQYVYLHRVVHLRIPTLSWVDERPHRIQCEQVPTKCACCQCALHGLSTRVAAVAGCLGSLDECSQRYRGGRNAPPRHTDVVSILVTVINEMQVSVYV